jgi:hypothetical protein
MAIPGIRMCDGDVHASYEGQHGVGGDVYGTGGSTQWGGGGGEKLLVCGGGDVGVVEAGGEVRGGVGVPSIGLTDRLSGSDRVWHKGRPGPVG